MRWLATPNTDASGSASFSGNSAGQSFYTPDNWFGSPTNGLTSNEGFSSGSTSNNSSSYSVSESYSTSESEADIPIFFPVPFRELSSVQYYSTDEQLTELTAALKQQFQRHCFIQIRRQETQPMLVPFVEPVTTFIYDRSILDLYVKRQYGKQDALPASEVDSLLEKQEADLQHEVTPRDSAPVEPRPDADTNINAEATPPPAATTGSICSRVKTPEPGEGDLNTASRKRGPKPDTENHEKVVRIVCAFGDSWSTDENLLEICEEFDRQSVPVPKTWATREDGVAHTWRRARHHYQHLVIKAIKDRLKAAGV